MNPKEGTVAETIYNATLAKMSADNALEQALEAIFGEGMCEELGLDEWSTDYYDNSLELYGIDPNTLEAGHFRGLIALGFSRYWMHFLQGGEPVEIHFTEEASAFSNWTTRPSRRLAGRIEAEKRLATEQKDKQSLSSNDGGVS